YLCDGLQGSCPTTCSGQANCVADAGCSGTMCTGARGNGQGCVNDTGCLSGHCADGVCCDTSCDGGACDRCDLSGSLGQCKNAVGSADAGCGAYLCGPSPVCPTNCTNDGDCASTHYC